MTPHRRQGPFALAAACRAGLAAALLAGAAHAAEAAAPADADLLSVPLASLLDMDVSGASKFELRRSESASAVTVITREELRALGHRTLADALRSVSGLAVQSDRVYSYLGVRGQIAPGDYNTRVLLLIDGNRVNDTVYDQAMIGSEFPLDLDLVERIEFIPGQGSAVHGANALFGVVNVVTRHPGAPGTTGVATVLGSEGERQQRATLSRALPNGGGLMISATLRRQLGSDVRVRGTGGADEWRTSHRTDAERAHQLYARYDDGELAATMIHAERRQGLTDAAGTVFGDRRNRYLDTQTLADVSLRRRYGEGTTWKNRLYLGRYAFRGDYVGQIEPLSRNQDRGEAQWWGLETTLVTERWTGHKVAVGADVQFSPRRDQSNRDLTGERTVYLDDQRSSRRYAVFAEDQWALLPRVALTAGLRLDGIEGRGMQWSPRLAVVARPLDDLTVKFIRGTAFRAPNAYESHYAASWEGGYKGNPRLRPEEVTGNELVVEGLWDARTRWTVGGYVNRARQLISQRVDPADGLYVFENDGTTEGRGLGAEIEHVRESGLRLRANVSAHRVRGDGDAGFGYPGTLRMAKLVAIVPLAADWTLGLDSALIGRRGSTRGYGLSDLTLEGPLPLRGARLALSLYNVFDRRPLQQGASGEGWTTSPRDGRRLGLKLDLAF